MYSGTTLRRSSGKIFGVHQRINRVAYRVYSHATDRPFPVLRSIQHFEGKHGPDGIKTKSPGLDEPWHFIDPTMPHKSNLLQDIRDHQSNLKQALQSNNDIRAAFEAAWLSHAITDGLTPAHHFPFEDELEALRGETKDTRDTLKRKLVVSGDTKRQSMAQNWRLWGAKGLMTSHLLFELGVASTTITVQSRSIAITPEEMARLESDGYEAMFLEALEAIHKLHMYEQFLRKGWTQTLARQTRNSLLPLIMHSVALSWYDASRSSSSIK